MWTMMEQSNGFCQWLIEEDCALLVIPWPDLTSLREEFLHVSPLLVSSPAKTRPSDSPSTREECQCAQVNTTRLLETRQGLL